MWEWFGKIGKKKIEDEEMIVKYLSQLADWIEEGKKLVKSEIEMLKKSDPSLHDYLKNIGC